MAFTPYSAKNAKVRINGTVLTSKKWTVEADGGDNDTSNFEGAGFTDTIGGLKGAVVTIEFDHDSSANMYAAPLSCTPGTTISSNLLYLNDTTSPFWSFPSALVLPGTMSADVSKNMAGTLKFKNKGTFSYPSGTF